MKNSRTLWVLAALITIASAAYQRMTGPTYPLRTHQDWNGTAIRARLDRTHAGPESHAVEVEAADTAVKGALQWKRFKVAEPWLEVDMVRQGNTLRAALPHQPPAGKLQYRVVLWKDGHELRLPAEEAVVIRFRGDVPAAVLIVHVIAMFGGMLLSTRTGLAAWARDKRLNKLTLWTLAFLIVGGLILGPVVQKYAFGAYWTGWPFGTDLTDNKTAAAVAVWLAAWLKLRRAGNPRAWVIGAAVATLVVFMIPHSVLGSELDYNA